MFGVASLSHSSATRVGKTIFNCLKKQMAGVKLKSAGSNSRLGACMRKVTSGKADIHILSNQTEKTKVKKQKNKTKPKVYHSTLYVPITETYSSYPNFRVGKVSGITFQFICNHAKPCCWLWATCGTCFLMLTQVTHAEFCSEMKRLP